MNIKKTMHKISSTITKAILVMVVFFGVIALFTSIANKDKIRIDPEETIKSQRADIYKLINDPAYQKNDAGKAAIGVYRALMCGTIGEACTDNPADADENFNHSLFGFVSNLIVMPYANPPASGVQYIAYSLGNAGLIPKTYAAEGIGFASIKPMIEIWKAFRNVAYLILVLVLIAIGFMIMFRMKLNPQTVISLENSLPKIVISLILITFSFAIAGLLIDAMYVGINVIISVLSSGNIKNLSVADIPAVQNKFIGAGMWDILPYKGAGWWGNILGSLSGGTLGPQNSIFGIGNSLVNLLPSWLHFSLRGVLLPIATSLYLSKTLPFLDPIWKGVKDTSVAGTSVGVAASVVRAIIWISGFIAVLPIGPGFILGILLIFTLAFLLFRIFFMLLMAYIKTMILILLSPIFLIFEAVPGKNVFMFWLKTLIGELMTFPLVIFLILLGYMISAAPSVKEGFFTPPFLYGLNPQAFAAIISFAILLLIPQLVKVAKELMGIKGMPEFKPGFFAGATTVLGGGLGLLGTFSSVSMGLGAFGVGGGKGAFSGIGRWFGQKARQATETSQEIANAGDMSGGKS